MILGCDPSSKKLAFFGVDKQFRMAHVFKLRGNERYSPAAAGAASQAASDILSVYPHAHQIGHLFIEEPVMGMGGVRSSIVQAYVNGVVQGRFVEAGWEVHIINVSTWKSKMGISTKGGKQAVYERMREIHPKDVELCNGDEDLLDAASLARYGVEAVRG